MHGDGRYKIGSCDNKDFEGWCADHDCHTNQCRKRDGAFKNRLKSTMEKAGKDRQIERDQLKMNADFDRAYAALGLQFAESKPDPSIHKHIQHHKLAGIVAWGLRQLGYND